MSRILTKNVRFTKYELRFKPLADLIEVQKFGHDFLQ